MKLSRRIIVWFFIIAALFPSFFGQPPARGSTFSTTPDGSKALYLLFERLGSPTPERLLQPFQNLPAHDRRTVLVIAAPERLGGETALKEWLLKGGQVLFFASSQEDGETLLKELGYTISSSTSRSLLEPTGVRTIVLPADLGGGALSISNFRGAPFSLPRNAELLAGTEKSPEIFRIRIGQGELLYFSHSIPIQNEFIDQADNLDLLFHLLRGAERVLFDEFHHGFVTPAPLERQSQLTALIWLSATILAMIFLFSLSRSVRFGPPIQSQEHILPPSTPFIEALGTLLASQRASSILAAYLRAFRIRAERRFRVNAALPETALFTDCSKSGLLSASEAQELSHIMNEIHSLTDGTMPLWEKHIAPLERFMNHRDTLAQQDMEGESR